MIIDHYFNDQKSCNFYQIKNTLTYENYNFLYKNMKNKKI